MKKGIKLLAIFTAICLVSACGGKKVESVPMLTATMMDVRMGEKATLEVTNYMGEIKWTSSDTSIATVSTTGDITPISIGSAAIAATLENGDTMNCVVDVLPGESKVEKISVVSTFTGISDMTVNYLDSPTVWLKAECSPVDPLEAITWSSSDERLATVSNDGVVMVCGNGIVTITATAVNGVSGSCKIRIKNVPEEVEQEAIEKSNDVPVIEITQGQSALTEAVPVPSSTAQSGIIISEPRVYLNVAEYTQLTYAVTNSSNNTVRWTSTDKSVALVKDGYIVGVGEGRAIISAVTHDGAVASCTVAVGKKAIKELKEEASDK